MDAFEDLIATLLEKDGFWVQTTFKVELTKEEKKEIGRPSSPRWKLDLIAYKASTNDILAVECKSYLDSYGVRLSGFDGSSEVESNRYKLFNESKLREVVFNRLVSQLEVLGACAPEPQVRLCLAVGHIYRDEDRDGLHALFEKNGWELLDEEWIKIRLKRLAEIGYENSTAAVVTKLLIRS
jgi:hypothetical protein